MIIGKVLKIVAKSILFSERRLSVKESFSYEKITKDIRMVRFPYNRISSVHYACSNLIHRVETCMHNECIGVIGISYQRFSF